MHRCVCIWLYILQNYNYKLHFQNLSIYHIPHVFIGTLAAENLDVCTACDPWDSNIQLTMVKDRRWQIYPNIVQCLTLTLVDCHLKCHSNRKLMTTQNKWPISPRGGHDDARYEHMFGIFVYLPTPFLSRKFDHQSRSVRGGKCKHRLVPWWSPSFYISATYEVKWHFWVCYEINNSILNEYSFTVEKILRIF
jgi:hypothetical protein